MGDISIGLYGEEEIFGGLFSPVLKGLFIRQLVKSVVDFDGIEMPAVVFEPLVLCKPGGIKQAGPILVRSA